MPPTPRDLLSNCWFYDEKREEVRRGERDVRVAKGTCYAEVAERRDASSRRSVDRSFEITFLFSRESDPSEPNDALDQARAASFGTPLLMTFFPRGDRDTLAFDAAAPGILRWRIESWPFRRPPKVDVFDGERRPIEAGAADARVPPGRLFVRIASDAAADESLASNRVVAVEVTLADDRDPHEATDGDAAKARKVALGEPFEVWLAPSLDVDLVRVEAQGYLELARAAGLAGPAAVAVDVEAEVRTLDGAAVGALRPGAGRMALPAPGEYALAIRATRHPGGAPDPVALVLNRARTTTRRFTFPVGRTDD